MTKTPSGAQVIPITIPSRGELWYRLRLIEACLAQGRTDRGELLAIVYGAKINDLLTKQRAV